MQVYNEVNWVGYAIDQAMMLCDKLLIVEGSQFSAFSDIPERSDDGTLDIISGKMRKYHDRIVKIDTIRKYNNYRLNQCTNFNRGLGFCNVGDYFLVLDADDFFKDEWIVRANNIMKEGGTDIVYVHSHTFVFSFNWIMNFNKMPTRPVIIKKTPELHFNPTHSIKGEGSDCFVDPYFVRYHYMWVKPPDRMLTRMETSGRYNGMVEWFNNTWMKIEPEDGKTYEGYNEDFTLLKYEGSHPSVLKNHPWKNIEDVRAI